MTLTEFLLARIAEDEAAVTGHRGYLVLDDVRRIEADMDGYIAGDGSTAIVGVGRVLAECEAKRRIVTEHPHLMYMTLPPRVTGCDRCRVEKDQWCLTLRLLALPYVDHPEFREEWRA